MTVLLRRSTELPPATGWRQWVSIGAEPAGLDPVSRRPGLESELEQAFDAAALHWLALGKLLGAEASAVLAHAPSAAPNPSDLGLMMAWSGLVDAWAAEAATTLVVCDDPWLFRHLQRRPGIRAGSSPQLWCRRLRLALRGLASRLAYAVSAARLAWTQRGMAASLPTKAPSLLVYGHPRSTAEGTDAYFGDLMARQPGVVRLLHVDARGERLNRLSVPGRTVSLHGFGSPAAALALPLARWKPAAAALAGEWSWLVRRAAALEGGTAQAAAIAWQLHCQSRWLARARPPVVAWPWENHGWERDFVRAARRAGVRTIGYQHSVIGRQMLNYAADSNPDGAASLPDHILCTGAATLNQLSRWGVPAERLEVGGARRPFSLAGVRFDPAAPVYVALPFDAPVAAEMVQAARAAAGPDRHFVVKDHPMTPFAFAESEGLTRTIRGLGETEAVSAVVFAATTVGLEATLMGLPTLRFRPWGRIALDILPDGVEVPATSGASLAADLGRLQALSPPAREAIFAAVDEAVWSRLLSAPPVNRGADVP